MFSLRYIEKEKSTPNGQIFCEIFEEASWIHGLEELPFKFEVHQNKNIIFSAELYPGMWASWHCEVNDNVESSIFNNQGKLISHFKLDIWTNRNSTEQFFDLWISKIRNAKGIVIGTHDGKTGEWVKHVKSGAAKSILVEGSEKQFIELVENYSDAPNVKFRNDIVTGDGRSVEFYEFGEGHANTVDKHHFEVHNSGKTFNVVKSKSISINDLIIEEKLQNSLDFLHLDTESIDDEIIMSLDFTKIKKPKLIVFETINFSEERIGNSERIDNLFKWLGSNGYLVKYDFWNSFAFLQEKNDPNI